EQRAIAERRALVEQYSHMPEVGRIRTQRRLPGYIQRRTTVGYEIRKSKVRKRERSRKNARRESTKQARVPERVKHIVKNTTD
ncbi:hypothetical protein KIPB_009846, partial [Kipferlia bialata]